MAGHPKDVILCNTMRACMPVAAGGDVYRITLENPGQQELLGEFMRELYGFMHDRLGNDNWRLETAMNRGEGSPLTWTDREVFNYLMKENSHFRELVEVFKLTL